MYLSYSTWDGLVSVSVVEGAIVTGIRGLNFKDLIEVV